ncbi:MAG: hypothetical protein K2Q13_03775 [Nitrosomonas sp.]|uniref:hypothetical protein n=1 Tax=Nitrosomonas sp. TaxID=42353 RepID=UPI0025D60B4D|nr:hypothetical protein [Nitrosomonas sp.]MBY0474165.1 hypothetical protein [Nitrosomonas sp.]
MYVFSSDSEKHPSSICILGCPRGGTSMVSGVLRILDVSMGENIDLDNNEDIDFLTHKGNRKIFRNRSNEYDQYINNLQKLIETRNNANNLWGWKDPLSGYYIQDIYEYLQSPIFIFITRDLVAIAEREAKEEFKEQSTNADSYLAYIDNALEIYKLELDFIVRNKPPTMFVSYEKSILNPTNFVLELIKFINYSSDDNSKIEAALNYIKPARGTAKI